MNLQQEHYIIPGLIAGVVGFFCSFYYAFTNDNYSDQILVLVGVITVVILYIIIFFLDRNNDDRLLKAVFYFGLSIMAYIVSIVLLVFFALYRGGVIRFGQ